jgi:hypothetical protein
MAREVFFEDVAAYRVPDIAAFCALGVAICDRSEAWHTLQRLRFSSRCMAVETEFLAAFHARIGAIWIDGDTGEKTFSVIGLGRSGEPFSFDIAERDYWKPRRFLRAINRHAGAGSFIMSGRVAATQRAIMELSQ